MRTHDVAILPGDGIGPEVVDATIKVLDAVQKKFDFKLNYHWVRVIAINVRNTKKGWRVFHREYPFESNM